MVREDILGGLRVALSKGYSLQNAMQSFYNSGYKKEDIEEAARYLQSHNFENPQAETQLSTSQKAQQPIKPTPRFTGYEETAVGTQPIPLSTQPKPSQQSEAQQTQQQMPKKKTNTKKIIWITILTIILLALIGGLISIFLYKDIIMSWFGK